MNTTPEEIILTIAERIAIKKRREGTTVVFFVFCIGIYYMYDKIILDMVEKLGVQYETNQRLANLQAETELFKSGSTDV